MIRELSLLSLLLGVMHPLLVAGESNAEDASAPRLHVSSGHSRPVGTVAFSQNGRWLATGSQDQTTRLWDVSTGAELGLLQGHSGFVQACHFAAKDAVLFSAGSESEAIVWDFRNGKPLVNIKTHYAPLLKFNLAGLETMAVDPGGQILATAQLKEARLWDFRTGRGPVLLQGHAAWIESLAVSPNATLVATGSKDKTIRLWSAPDGRLLRTLQGHQAKVTGLAFGPKDGLLLSGDDDGRMIVWNARQGELIQTLLTSSRIHPKGVTIRGVAFSSDGHHVAAAGYHGAVCLFDLRQPRTQRTLGTDGLDRLLSAGSSEKPPGHDGPVNAVAFSPDGRLLASSGDDCTARVWDVASGRELMDLGGGGRLRSLSDVAFEDSGDRIVVVGDDGLVRYWNVRLGRPEESFTLPIRITKSVIGRDGRSLLSCSKQTSLFDLEAAARHAASVGSGSRLPLPAEVHAKLSSFVTSTWAVRSTALSPDGRWAAALSGPGELAEVVVWDVAARKVDKRLPSPFGRQGTGTLCFSQDGQRLLVVVSDRDLNQKEFLQGGRAVDASTPQQNPSPAAGRTYPARTSKLTAWEVGTWRQVGQVAVGNGRPQHICGLPDRRLVVVGHAGLCDVEKQKTLGLLEGVKGPFAVAPSANLLATHREGTITLWNTDDFSEVGVLKGHASGVNAMRFDSAGVRLVSVSGDNTVKLWNIRTATLQATFVAESDDQWVAHLPDGYYQSSTAALDRVRFVAGMESFSLDELELLFNRPDVVLARLGCKDADRIRLARAARRQRLKRLGINESSLEVKFPLPRLVVHGEDLPRVADAPQVTIRVRAANPKTLFEHLAVWVNGVPARVPAADQPWNDRTIELQLSRGRNRIEISATAQGTATPREVVVIDNPNDPARRTLFVVAVGVSKHRISQIDLRYADKDARDLVALLRSPNLQGMGRDRFDDIQVLELTNEQATCQRILGARSFLANSTVHDTVLVFFAGHGYLDSELNYYFGAHETDPAKLCETGLPFDDLYSLMQATPARNKLLLLDTCHAGEPGEAPSSPQPMATTGGDSGLPADGRVVARVWTRGVGGTRPPDRRLRNMFALEKSLLADLRRDSGAFVIAACAAEEFSVEGTDWSNGAFTFALLECLRTATGDGNQDGAIQVSELQSYVADRVRELTDQRQHPHDPRRNLQNDFTVFSPAPAMFETVTRDGLFPIWRANLSVDGRRLLVSHADEVSLWNTQTQSLMHQIPKETKEHKNLGFSPDGRRFFVEGSKISVYDTETGLLQSAVAMDAKPLRPIALTDADHMLEFSRSTDEATSLNLATRTRSALPLARQQTKLVGMDLQGSTMAAIYADGWVRIIDAVGGEVLDEWQAEPAQRVMLSPNNHCVWLDEQSGATLFSRDGRRRLLHLPPESVVRGLAFSADGSRLVYSHADEWVVWNIPANREVSRFSPPKGARCHGFSPQGHLLLLVAGGVLTPRCMIWDAHLGVLVRNLSAHHGGVCCVGFTSGDQKLVTISRYGKVRIWPMPQPKSKEDQ